MEEIAHGEIGITVDDSTVDSQLRSVQTRYKLAMERIDRMEGKAKLGADLDRLKADLKIASEEVKRWEAEYKTSSNEITKTELNNAKRRRDGLTQEIKQKQALRKSETDRIQTLRTMEQRVAANARMTEGHTKALNAQAAAHRNSGLEAAKQHREIADLEAAYVKATDRVEKFHKESRRSFGETKIKVDIEKGRAEAHMEELKARLAALGRVPPVGIRVDTDWKSWEGIKNKMGQEVGSLVNKLGTIGHVRLNLGPLSGTIRTFAIGISTLGPLVTSLTAGLGALVGVAGTGLAGAGALGAAALTGLGLAGAGALLTIKPLATEFKTTSQATAAYNKAVLKFGEGSKQATKAQQQMNSALKGVSPEVRMAAQDLSKFQTQWRKLTSGAGGARAQFGGILSGFAGAANQLERPLASGTNQMARTLRSSFQSVFRELGSQSAKSGIGTIFDRFNRSIPEAVGGLNHFGIAFGRISLSASRFLPMVTHGFGQMGVHFANATGNSNHLDAVIGRLVTHAQSIVRLFGAAGHVLVDFFNTGANSGNRMVVSLTNTINKWDQWIRSTKGQTSLHDFFERGRKGTDQFFRALLPLLKAFGEWSNALQPVTTGILTFVTWLSRAVGALTHLAVAGPALKALGFTLAAIFVTSKIATWISLIQKAGIALGIFKARTAEAAVAQGGLAASETTAAAAARAEAAATGTAGGAAAAGAAARGGGRFAGLARAANIVPAIGTAAVLAHDAQQVGRGRQIPSLTQGFGAVTGIHLPKAVNFAGPLLPVTGAIAGINALGKTLGIFDSGSKKASHFNTTLKQLQQGKISLQQATQEIGKLGNQSGKPLLVARSLRALQNNIGALKNSSATDLGDLRRRFNQNMTDIEHLMGTHSLGARRAMDQNMKATFTNLRTLMSDGHRDSNHYLGLIKDSFNTNMRESGRITDDNIRSVVSTIRAGMQSGAIATDKGLQAIAGIYRDRLKQLDPGISQADLDLAAKRAGKDGSFGLSQTGGPHAVGGYISGSGMHDTVQILAAPGEAVLNRHQIPVVQSALQAIGINGLTELFSKVQTPHYAPMGKNTYPQLGFASGGEIPRFASGGPVFQAIQPPTWHGPGGYTGVYGDDTLIHAANTATQLGRVIAAHLSGPIHSILSTTAGFSLGRVDHGRDFETMPGANLLAVGAGSMHYPGTFPGAGGVLSLDQPWQGQSNYYYGHARAGLGKGRVVPGDPVAVAGGVGAPGMPGHVEFGPATSSTGGLFGVQGHAEGPQPMASKATSLLHKGDPQHFASGGWVFPRHWGRRDSSGNNIDQSTNLSTGAWAHGVASHFGPPAEAGPSTGVSTPFGNARGGYWLMHAPNGNWAIERQTDAGPNLGLKRMFDLTEGSMHDLGSGDGPGYQGMFLGRSTHGYHTGRIGRGQGAFLAATLSGGGTGAGPHLITKWDDRGNRPRAETRSKRAWDHMKATTNYAYAHYHPTRQAAQKAIDARKRKHPGRAPVKSPAATTVGDIKSQIPETFYTDLDLAASIAALTPDPNDDEAVKAQRRAADIGEIGKISSDLDVWQRLLQAFPNQSPEAMSVITGLMNQDKVDLTNLYQDLATNAPGTAGGGTDNADVQAQLAQAQSNLVIARQEAATNAAFATAAGGPGDIGMGGYLSARQAAQSTPGNTIIVNTLHPGDPNTLTAIANATVAGMGYQGAVASPRLVTGV